MAPPMWRAAKALAIFQESVAPRACRGISLKATRVPTTVATDPMLNATNSLPVSLNIRLGREETLVESSLLPMRTGMSGNLPDHEQHKACLPYSVTDMER